MKVNHFHPDSIRIIANELGVRPEEISDRRPIKFRTVAIRIISDYLHVRPEEITDETLLTLDQCRDIDILVALETGRSGRGFTDDGQPWNVRRFLQAYRVV